ncbi:hypothetical protein SLEP1_g17491 [Rubroshorea leprosula]|uniref:Uncharacterized protein n=1 Tax=Rubroshorea leprosula TaxID=152421 RepID=A0AAV5J3I6_9ROSI|nr:hypothetical protein SLEP1_g17491 [Rubroshorea leprosula]
MWIVSYEFNKFRALCICGILPQVYDVCFTPSFGA